MPQPADADKRAHGHVSSPSRNCSRAKSLIRRKRASAKGASQKNAGDDCRGTGAQTDAQRNIVLHVESHGR